MKIILIGFMGSGKTSVGKELSKKLRHSCIEMDEFILKASRRNNVNEIFDKDGEIKFRELEMATAKKLRVKDNVVVSCGGGIVMNKINIDHLKQNGLVVFLNTSFETIKKRLDHDTTRPLFRDLAKTKKLYDFRQSLYHKYANIIIDTDNKTIKKVRDEIIIKLKKYETISQK